MNAEKTNIYYEVHPKGKSAIPCLLDLIDTDRKSFVGFQDPESSSVNSFSSNNYSGINVAYLVELILAKDSIVVRKSSTWKTQVEPYRIYTYGVIVKNVNNSPLLRPLEYSDMKTLKDIYLAWWKLNKNKSIEQLRRDWKAGKGPLATSKYKWI
ncbi:hypothetical protein [Xanthocytophaga flava]|uniref:hypothetical protein n=1 Tax=Xanthocytophaga flava TaxID=3048013 RepID=UPI0028D7EFE4|nr:hypothetical protein [Xanthocytophaga flavus]MDJ1473643.1 hypothetical protein [Xanthocytophaga flavus]